MICGAFEHSTTPVATSEGTSVEKTDDYGIAHAKVARAPGNRGRYVRFARSCSTRTDQHSGPCTAVARSYYHRLDLLVMLHS